MVKRSNKMSGSEDSSSENMGRCGKSKKKIVMRIEFDDSDGSTSEEDSVRPSCSSNRSKNRGNRNRVISSDDSDSSTDSEVIRTVIVRGRTGSKAVIHEDDMDEVHQNNSSNSGNALPSNSFDNSTSSVLKDDGFSSDSSTDNGLEKCPICLLSFRNQEIGSPNTCDHLFCALCIEEWSKNVTTCPIDRNEFKSITVRQSFENKTIVREVNIEKTGAPIAEEDEEDHTRCEVCHQSDREDVMLLCDGCNHGFHMDCLTPPLAEVPEGFWYCDNCFESESEASEDNFELLYEDLQEIGVPSTRLRIREVQQPRITRTRQSERIRASIVARTRPTRSNRHQVRENANQPRTSSSRQTQSVAPSTSRTTKSRRKGTSGRRRARRGRRYKTYVVEYDLNGSEKFPIKTTRRVIKRRKRRRTRRSTRNQPSNNSAQCQQVSLGRAEIGVSFSLFGDANALDYFSDDSDVTDSLEMGRGEAGVAMAARSRLTHQSTGARIRQKGVIRDLDRPTRSLDSSNQPAPQPDVLSNILEMQSFWHNTSTSAVLGEVKINPDGTLKIPKRSEDSKSPIKSKEEKKIDVQKPEKSETTPAPSGAQNEITQAPMYPRGGGGGGSGGGNYSFSSRGGGGNYNNRFNNQSSGYRGTNNSTFGSNSNFRNSTGGLGSSGFNAFQRDNNNFQGTNLPSGHYTTPDFRNRFRNPNNNNNNNNQRRNFIQFPNFMASTPNITVNTANSLNSSLNSALSNLSTNITSNFNDRCQNVSIEPQPMREIGPQLPSPSQMSDKDDGDSSSNGSGDDERTNDTLDIPLPLYSPTSSFNETEKTEKEKHNQSGQDEKKTDDQISKIVPPLQPPPWNNNLFRLAASYDDQDDDDDDCPNFSVYSAESFQVARSSDDTKPENADNVPQEDDCEEKEEDLVQLGDDDDIPDAIESEKKVDKTENGSEIYDPEDPNTDVYSEKDMEESENDEPFDEESLDKESLDNESKDDNDDSEKPPEDSAGVADIKKTEEKDTERATEDRVPVKKAVDPDDSTINTSKKSVLELYDDSDWEEWNIEKTEVMKSAKPTSDKSVEEDSEKHDDDSEDEETQPAAAVVAEPEKKAVAGTEPEHEEDDEEEEGELSRDEEIEQVMAKSKENTESISEEEERSYTPCLDEKIDHNESIKEKESEENDIGKKSDGENQTSKSHKDDESDRALTPPGRILGMDTEMINSDEDEEILNEEHNRGSTERKKDAQDKKGKKGQFKKISKSTKGRNYRDKDGVKRRGRSPSRSHNRETRQDRSGRRRMRRKDMERYDVRNVIGQPRTYKDRYGRDTSRPARSLSRSRSRVRSKSRSGSRNRRHRSRSKSRSKSIRRSFSMSPTPASFGRYTPRRTSRSPRRSKSIRRSRSFRRSPMGKRRGKSPVRGRSLGRRRSPMRSRSPIRGRTPQRLRSPIRARTPNRLRSRSMSRSYSKSISRSRSFNGSISGSPRLAGKRMYRKRRSQSSSPSGSRSPVPKKKRSRSLRKASREKRKERKKKKSKKHSSPAMPTKRTQRRVSHNGEVTRKKKRRSRTRSPIVDRFSETPPLNAGMNADPSWTPPLAQSNAENLRVILSNKELLAKRRKEKKKKAEKRREKNSNKERRKQRSALRDSPVAPSKEVFASGDNILVSVSFNKENTQPQQTTVVTLPPTREEIISRRTPERVYRKSKKKDKSQKRHKKTDAKPVAIIDLDRSPFQVIAQSPKDVIILTDSEREAEEEEESNDMNKRKNNVEIQTLERTPIDMRMESMEKNLSVERSEKATEVAFDMPQLGPKTPPEPPIVKFSLPSKNKQIKSRNPLHEQEEIEDETPEKNDEQESQNGNKIGPNTPPESGPCSPDAYDPFDPTKSPSASPSTPPPAEMPQTIPDTDTNMKDVNADKRDTRQMGPDKNINPVELVMALMTSKQALSQDVCKINSEPAYITTNNDMNDDTTEENNMTKSITVLSNVLIAPGKHGNIPTIASPQNVMSKLPMPKQSNNRINGGASNEELFEDLESPYSPGSADYEDLFEPPPETNRSRSSKGNKPDIFDHLFGSSPTTRNQAKKRSSKQQQQHRKFSVRVAKVPGTGMDPDQIKIFDDLPSSAVELQVKDKYVRKLHRQERVVEEVKLVLKPYYTKKIVSKEVYKEILRRSVPKICHSRSGEINPKKIQNLVEAYVKKFRQKLKLSLLSGTAQVSSASKCAAYLKKL